MVLCYHSSRKLNSNEGNEGGNAKNWVNLGQLTLRKFKEKGLRYQKDSFLPCCYAKSPEHTSQTDTCTFLHTNLVSNKLSS